MYLFLRPEPVKARATDPVYVFELADDDWAALAGIIAAEPEHVVIPFTDGALLEFPSEQES
jgi:hypothetical protein